MNPPREKASIAVCLAGFESKTMIDQMQEELMRLRAESASLRFANSQLNAELLDIQARAKSVVKSCLHGHSQAAEEFAYELAGDRE